MFGRPEVPIWIRRALKQVGFPDSLEDSIKGLSYVGIVPATLL